MTETDAEFLDRLVRTWMMQGDLGDWSRLFALARRGAAAKAEDRRKGVGCYESCEWTRDQHHIKCPHFDPIYPPTPAIRRAGT